MPPITPRDWIDPPRGTPPPVSVALSGEERAAALGLLDLAERVYPDRSLGEALAERLAYEARRPYAPPSAARGPLAAARGGWAAFLLAYPWAGPLASWSARIAGAALILALGVFVFSIIPQDNDPRGLPTPTPALSPTPENRLDVAGGWLVPPSAAVCRDWQERLAMALGVEVWYSDSAPYLESTSGSSETRRRTPPYRGYGCLLTAYGDAARLGDLNTTLGLVEPMLKANGFTTYGSFAFEGGSNNQGYEGDEYGRVTYLGQGSLRAALGVSGRPGPDAACPEDNPGCDLPPESMQINVRLRLAEDKTWPTLHALIGTLLEQIGAGDPSALQVFDPGLAEQYATVEGLRDQLGLASPIDPGLQSYGSPSQSPFNYAFVSFNLNQVTAAFYNTRAAESPLASYFGPLPAFMLTFTERRGGWLVTAVTRGAGESPPSPPEGFLKPSSGDQQACAEIAHEIDSRFGWDPAVTARAPFRNPGQPNITEDGEACQVRVDGTGPLFTSPDYTLDWMETLLGMRGFTAAGQAESTDSNLTGVFGGAYGYLRQFRRDTGTPGYAQASIQWNPGRAASCPVGGSVAECLLPIRAQTYTLLVRITSDTGSRQVDDLMQLFVEQWKTVNPEALRLLTEAARQQVVASGGLQAVMGLSEAEAAQVSNYRVVFQAYEKPESGPERLSLRLLLYPAAGTRQSGMLLQARHLVLERVDPANEVGQANEAVAAGWAIASIQTPVQGEADRLFDAGQIEQAVQAHKLHTESYPEDAVGWAALARAQMFLGDSYAAQSSAQKAVDANPSLAIARAVLGWSKINSYDWEAGMHDLQTALEMDPRSPYIHAWMAQGILAQRMQFEFNAGYDPAPALSMAQTAVYLNPNLLDAQMALGDALRANDRPAEAAEAYRRAVELNPGLVNLRLNLALALIESPGGMAEGRQVLDGAVERIWDDPYKLAWAAEVYMRLNDPAEAVKTAARMVELEPHNPYLRALYGKAAFLNDDHNLAAEQFRLALVSGVETLEVERDFSTMSCAPGCLLSSVTLMYGVSLARAGDCEQALAVRGEVVAEMRYDAAAVAKPDDWMLDEIPRLCRAMPTLPVPSP